MTSNGMCAQRTYGCNSLLELPYLVVSSFTQIAVLSFEVGDTAWRAQPGRRGHLPASPFGAMARRGDVLFAGMAPHPPKPFGAGSGP